MNNADRQKNLDVKGDLHLQLTVRIFSTNSGTINFVFIFRKLEIFKKNFRRKLHYQITVYVKSTRHLLINIQRTNYSSKLRIFKT